MKTIKLPATDPKTLKPESKPQNTKNLTDRRQFPIVGIGASAGGLEALEPFFKNMPVNSGMAFVLVQHLDPAHKSIMPELIQRFTDMKVFQVTDNLKVKANCVYVIPPNKSMSILKDVLYLFDPVEPHGLRLPIDTFFRSLAEDRQDKSIGIILSGMGTDGSLGMKAIKERDGIVLVQSPVSAKFDGMPRSAIESVVADIVANADELPAKLIAYLKFVPPVHTEIEIDDKSKNNLDKIIILLREQSGHDFSLYKKSTLFRRIERRKGIHQIDKIQNYVRYCQENPKEIEILFKELLIGVTNFFRDAPVWEMLKEQVLPELIAEFPNRYVIRAWVTGCSTGEEAYTLAIIFKEVIERAKIRKNLSLQIFATDLDPDAIEIARRGVYSSNIAADVSQDRLNRFFSVEGEGYKVNAPIREMIVFAPQNVIKDPPFTKLDLLSCRNMLIYMEPELQKKLISLFNYSLNPGGVLVLGSSETLGNNREGFDDIDTRLKIYKRTVTPLARHLIEFPDSFFHKGLIKIEKNIPIKAVESIQTLADQILLQRYAPASVLVNEKGDILYITGHTGKYLEPVPGKANWNIFAMAREGINHELPVAFRKAMQSFEPVVVPKIKLKTKGESQFVNITVQRIESPDSIKGMIMVVFSDVTDMIEVELIKTKKRKSDSTGIKSELELKLQRSYEELQSAREEMQTSQEELKSTNEELQSTNEELQSTNEELTTSKEEMQSMNEELQTVNSELLNKINDFAQSNNDMKNLLNSTEIATLFLDKELNIRRFTDNVVSLIKLRNTDIGRPFTDQVTDLLYPEMDADARQVIKTLKTVETAIETYDGRWFEVRIMPYRTMDDRIDGVVITFTDITVAKKLEIKMKQANDELKAKEDALILSEARYRSLFDSSKDGMLILDAETGKIMDVNPYLIEMLGYSKEYFIQKEIWEISSFKDIVANEKEFLKLKQKEFVCYENLLLETAKGQSLRIEFISNLYSANDQKVIQCQIRDFRERK